MDSTINSKAIDLQDSVESLDLRSGGDMLMAIQGSSYDGSISSTILDYFDGYIARLNPSTPYLLYRSGTYEYTLVYGDALTSAGAHVSASDASYVKLNTYNGYQVSKGSDSVDVYTSQGMVYSNLDGYPIAFSGVSNIDGKAIFCILFVLLLYSIVRDIFSFTRSC